MCEPFSQWSFVRHRVSLDTGVTERANGDKPGTHVVEGTIFFFTTLKGIFSCLGS